MLSSLQFGGSWFILRGLEFDGLLTVYDSGMLRVVAVCGLQLRIKGSRVCNNLRLNRKHKHHLNWQAATGAVHETRIHFLCA